MCMFITNALIGQTTNSPIGQPIRPLGNQDRGGEPRFSDRGAGRGTGLTQQIRSLSGPSRLFQVFQALQALHAYFQALQALQALQIH
jgi:hypothetical protein